MLTNTATVMAALREVIERRGLFCAHHERQLFHNRLACSMFTHANAAAAPRDTVFTFVNAKTPNR